ncbi:MAG TPA: 50S ribosomal protein L4 [Candidatus Dormibacteraeota bacterium]|nr:50S ribosomal protein L4 [Candidatus Dormibacteraeota bacterium]
MAEKEKKTPKPRAPRAKKTAEIEVSAEIPMMAEALTPEDEEPKKPVRKAAAKPVAKAAAKPAARAAARPAPKAEKPARRATVRKSDSPLDVQVYDSKGAEAGELRLPESIFGQAPNMGVMHQALQRQLNNARQGTSATKTRGMVSGGGRKPFRQKGLGRSRHGSEREPSMVGGGTVWGPHPRSYRQDMPRKMRRLALRSALSVKASEGRVSVIEGFAEMEVPRTRVIVELLESVGAEGSTLVVLASANELVSRSAANLPWAKTILAHNLNLYDLFTHDHVVIAKDALELIEETFA